MRNWLFACLILLTACSTGVTSQLYVLPTQETSPMVTTSAPVLVIRQVDMAPYLNNAGLVYRTSETQVIQTKQNLWAENISAQLTERIVNDLRAKQSKYWPVQLNPTLKLSDKPQLQVRMQRFNGSYTGDAEIAGEWTLIDEQGDIEKTQAFRYSVPLDSEGYPALVKSLAEGVDRMTSQISVRL